LKVVLLHLSQFSEIFKGKKNQRKLIHFYFIFNYSLFYVTLDYASVCTVTRIRIDDRGLISGQLQTFSHRNSIQAVSEAHPASYLKESGVLSPEGKRQSVKLNIHLHLAPRL
jgi:hypothetical protein